MNLIKNYALFLESKAFRSTVTESMIEEADAAAPDMQTADGLKKIMSGENGGAYVPQWNQLVDHMAANKKKDGTYTANIIHDNKKAMANVEYKVAGGKVDWNSVKLSASTQASGSTVVAADATALEQKAQDLSAKFVALFVEGSEFFADFKGNWNDEDAAAATAFETWYKTFIEKEITSIRAKADTLTDDISKAVSKSNADAIEKAKTTIIAKMKGSWDTDDSVTWKVGKSDGTFKSYKVDTDF